MPNISKFFSYKTMVKLIFVNCYNDIKYLVYSPTKTFRIAAGRCLESLALVRAYFSFGQLDLFEIVKNSRQTTHPITICMKDMIY